MLCTRWYADRDDGAALWGRHQDQRPSVVFDVAPDKSEAEVTFGRRKVRVEATTVVSDDQIGPAIGICRQ